MHFVEKTFTEEILMKTLGNILWVIFGGLEWFLVLILEGVLCCVSIIGIPVGIQIFKMAKFVIWPFGKNVQAVKPSGFKQVVNVIWAISGGWMSALGFLFTGVLYCITIIGIPFGKQYFKMAKFILLPLGNDFVKDQQPKKA